MRRFCEKEHRHCTTVGIFNSGRIDEDTLEYIVDAGPWCMKAGHCCPLNRLQVVIKINMLEIELFKLDSTRSSATNVRRDWKVPNSREAFNSQGTHSHAEWHPGVKLHCQAVTLDLSYPIPNSSADSRGVPQRRQITAAQSPQVSGSVTSAAHFGQ